ncbi:MAG: hypothetical protein GX892_11895 [Thermoanaerobacteraceae bacterium]|nr:hypothetical protein [Thermoanaerobacteraceae bacterium]
MRKNLGMIICKRDATEGTIYSTEICDYLIYEENSFYVVEGLTKYLKREIDFIHEDEKAFVVGCFRNEKDALKGIADFEKQQWGK